MTPARLLSIRTGPWSFSLALHLAFFAGLLTLGRDRVIDLTLLDLGAPRVSRGVPASAAVAPKEDVWRYPDAVRRAVPAMKAVPTPEPETVAAVPGAEFGSGGPYRSVAQVSQIPRFAKQVEVEYPEEAKRANVEGLVILQVEIDDQGAVQNVEVVKGLGYGCDEAAVAAVRQSTFTPALVGNEPVPVRIRIPYRFKFEY